MKRARSALGRAFFAPATEPLPTEPLAFDFEDMLVQINEQQWALADIDWDAMGVIQLHCGTSTSKISPPPVSARAVVMASGPLANASFPAIRGFDTYAGHKIHSARWDHDYDSTDKKVAVIGTGASGVQIISELVKVAQSGKVFQRTAALVR